MKTKIIASIRLFSGPRKRQTAITSGYRPIFSFPNATSKTSGQIELLDRKSLTPGDSADVEVTFLFREFLGDQFKVGAHFTFSEGNTDLGDGIVKRIIR